MRGPKATSHLLDLANFVYLLLSYGMRPCNVDYPFQIWLGSNSLLSLCLQAIKNAGIDVEAFITVGVSAALRQLLEFGLFHGDPHPGNIFAMRDGRIAYVDFGNVAELSQVSSENIGSYWRLVQIRR